MEALADVTPNWSDVNGVVTPDDGVDKKNKKTKRRPKHI